MEVLDHGPHAWFLFRKDRNLLLDVNCNHSAVGYSVLICLNSDEVFEYAVGGRAYLDRLSQEVQNSGPGGGDQGRDVSAAHTQECKEALERWRASIGELS